MTEFKDCLENQVDIFCCDKNLNTPLRNFTSQSIIQRNSLNNFIRYALCEWSQSPIGNSNENNQREKPKGQIQAYKSTKLRWEYSFA